MSFERQESGGSAAADSAVAPPKIGASSRVHDHGASTEAAPTKVGARSLTERLPIQAKAAMAGAAGEATEPSGGGAALPGDLRTSMESSFGADFGNVRVHQGGNAAAFGATAYAQGDNLHFQPGAYNPESESGRELIGHELAHVVQQREGRVALPQGKGDPINADASLEAEADAQGAKAARGEPARGSASPGSASAGAGGPVQRKVLYGDGKAAKPMADAALMQALDQLGVVAEAGTLLRGELKTKPNQMQQELKDLKVEDRGFVETIVKEWNSSAGDHKYGTGKPEAERVLLDSFRNFLHIKHKWRNIGVAQYMTGDATGLAIAPLVDPSVTINVITGNQKKNTPGPSFVGEGGKLPGYFKGAEDGGNIVKTPHPENKFGTQQHYTETFNANNNNTVAPWNKETYEATQVIADGYADPEKRKVIQSQLQLGDGDHEQKKQIEAYKREELDPTVGTTPCVFLWGRESGKKGGAHKELDSHAEMMLQIAKKIGTDFASHIIMLVGDPVISTQDLIQAGVHNPARALGEFWNHPKYGKDLKDRNAQRYLFQLFHRQNNAVSIGMRSGSLEGMALLGLRVVFIDDQGNNAEGRMEMWAGKGAHERGAKVRGGANEEQLEQHEDQTKGPMENYKRVGTLLTMGDQVEARKKSLANGSTFITKLLTDVDYQNLPICTANGNKEGNGFWLGIFGAQYNANLMIGKMPTEPAKSHESDDTAMPASEIARTFTTNLAKFVADVPKDIKDKPPAPRFATNTADLDKVQHALEHDLAADTDGKAALDRIAELRTMKDQADVLLVGDHATSSTSSSLFAKLVEKIDGKKTLTPADAKAFVKTFDQRRAGMNSKAPTERPRFTRTDIEKVAKAIKTLQDNNVMQPDELEQISHLTKSLGKKA